MDDVLGHWDLLAHRRLALDLRPCECETLRAKFLHGAANLPPWPLGLALPSAAGLWINSGCDLVRKRERLERECA